MKFFILFIIFNLSSLAFAQVQAQTPEVLEADLQTENPETSSRDSSQFKALVAFLLEDKNFETHSRELSQTESSILKVYTGVSTGTGFFIGPKSFCHKPPCSRGKKS